MRSEVVETGRPSLVAGDDERRSEPRGLPEMERRVEVVDARAPPVERIAEAALRDTVEVARRAGGERHGVRRPDGRDEPARVGVPGLRDPRPCRSGEALLDRVPVERGRGIRHGAHEARLLRGRHARAHAAALRRRSARPTCAASGRSAPSRSARVHARRSACRGRRAASRACP